MSPTDAFFHGLSVLISTTLGIVAIVGITMAIVLGIVLMCLWFQERVIVPINAMRRRMYDAARAIIAGNMVLRCIAKVYWFFSISYIAVIFLAIVAGVVIKSADSITGSDTDIQFQGHSQQLAIQRQ